MKRMVQWSGLLIAVLVSGCAATRAQRDPVTFGMVKERLQVGITTQDDVLRVFGAPNIITRTREGQESWAYQRSGYSSSERGAAVTAFGGGLPGAGLVGGAGSVWGSTYESGSNMVTLLVRFDPAGRVADYAMQESHF